MQPFHGAVVISCLRNSCNRGQKEGRFIQNRPLRPADDVLFVRRRLLFVFTGHVDVRVLDDLALNRIGL